MDREQLTPEQQALIDAHRAQYGVQPSDVVDPATNLVVDDHISLDPNWPTFVVLNGRNGAIDCFIAGWGDMIDNIAIPPLMIQDRAGPNGETMPVLDEQQLELLRAAAAENPNAAKKERRERVREFLAAQSADVSRRLRKAIHQHGGEELKD